jgi:hypothetical protein
MKLELENRFANVVLSVNALAEELQYTRNMLKEAERVIKQLSQETLPVDEPVLIHPADLFELIQNTQPEYFDLFLTPDVEIDSKYTYIRGVKYEQSAFMPIKSKSIR